MRHEGKNRSIAACNPSTQHQSDVVDLVYRRRHSLVSSGVGKTAWTRVDGRATELPGIKMWAGCHCAETCRNDLLTPFCGRRQMYEDLLQVVNDLEELASWI